MVSDTHYPYERCNRLSELWNGDYDALSGREDDGERESN